MFGNVAAVAGLAEPADRLAIWVECIVKQCATAWPIFRIAPEAHSFPFTYLADEVTDLGAFRQSWHPDPDGQLERWARAFARGSPTDTLSLLKNINLGVSDAVAYRTRDEAGTQAPLASLELASGSCRDMASLFIDAVRLLGFGARACSGYLCDPDARSSDAGSTHAWAEVYLPSAGWIAFDPTHRRLGSAHLVAAAVGRCNGQILPVIGGFLGSADDSSGMDVAVRLVPT